MRMAETTKKQLVKGSPEWREAKRVAKQAIDDGTWKHVYGGLSERRQKEKKS